MRRCPHTTTTSFLRCALTKRCPHPSRTNHVSEPEDHKSPLPLLPYPHFCLLMLQIHNWIVGCLANAPNSNRAWPAGHIQSAATDLRGPNDSPQTMLKWALDHFSFEKLKEVRHFPISTLFPSTKHMFLPIFKHYQLPSLDMAFASSLGAIPWMPRPILKVAAEASISSWGHYEPSDAAALQVKSNMKLSCSFVSL
jgi:hypothetical protein